MAQITFISRNHNLHVIGDDQADCEHLLQSYLGVYHGGLEIAERSNAEVYLYVDSTPALERGVTSFTIGNDDDHGEYVLGERWTPAAQLA